MTIAEKIQQVAENSEAIANNELRVYEAGQEKGESDFWNQITQNNKRDCYIYGFNRWGKDYLRPPYVIAPTDERTGINMFSESSIKKIEAKYFDLSKKIRSTLTNRGFYCFCGGCFYLEEIEDIGLQADSSYLSAFSYCYKLHTIALLRSAEDTYWSNTFTSCRALENLTIEGVIGQNGFDVQYSTKLSKDSITSIINALSTETTGLTVTLSLAAVNTAFESGAGAGDGSNTPEWAALEASKSNWTISLV